MGHVTKRAANAKEVAAFRITPESARTSTDTMAVPRGARRIRLITPPEGARPADQNGGHPEQAELGQRPSRPATNKCGSGCWRAGLTQTYWCGKCLTRWLIPPSDNTDGQAAAKGKSPGAGRLWPLGLHP